MNDTKTILMLMTLLVVALFMSYDSYIELQKESIVDSFFEDYEDSGLVNDDLDEIFDDEDEQELDEETNAADEAQEQIIEPETNTQTTEHETSSHGSNTPDS